MAEEKIRFRNRLGETLVGIIHTPKKPTQTAVIVCHGLRGTKDILWIAELCNALARKGYCALRFDFSGNGESEGSFTHSIYSKEVEDLKTAIDYLENQGYVRFITIGHSMGGGVVLLEAAKDIRVAAVVEIAAPAHPAKNEAFVRGVLTRLGIKEQDTFVRSLQATDIVSLCAKIKVRVLVIHGDADNRVPIADSKELCASINHCTLTILPSADHYFDTASERNNLITTIMEWIPAP
ncbi:alpha/beta fold hydrolase [Candidatus Woesearchaeota archaeon]|nr:alpha/beta fold hydrolase [Candidatus Woesearchaeota archaeon]